jgi:hypothetical protein
MKNNLPAVGTIVRAIVNINDEASNGRVQQHAAPGDTGVVWEYSCDEIPTINWSAGTGSGFYDSPWTDLEIVEIHAK